MVGCVLFVALVGVVIYTRTVKKLKQEVEAVKSGASDKKSSNNSGEQAGREGNVTRARQGQCQAQRAKVQLRFSKSLVCPGAGDAEATNGNGTRFGTGSSHPGDSGQHPVATGSGNVPQSPAVKVRDQ